MVYTAPDTSSVTWCITGARTKMLKLNHKLYPTSGSNINVKWRLKVSPALVDFPVQRANNRVLRWVQL